MGSSPHTRGARSSSRSLGAIGRIIPAYAGSTPRCNRETGTSGDHPRIRGEHFNSTAPRRGTSWIIPAYAGSTARRCSSTRYAAGSSPHTRGARRRAPYPAPGPRIIPAYAGSTRPRCIAPRAIRDHPRIRGEHDVGHECLEGMLGSSPHTRGALSTGGAAASVSGIIPAYAGSTPNSWGGNRWPRDHPRIRGEHRVGDRPALDGDGIIPAYAGSTN